MIRTEIHLVSYSTCRLLNDSPICTCKYKYNTYGIKIREPLFRASQFAGEHGPSRMWPSLETFSANQLCVSKFNQRFNLPVEYNCLICISFYVRPLTYIVREKARSDFNMSSTSVDAIATRTFFNIFCIKYLSTSIVVLSVLINTTNQQHEAYHPGH